MQFIQVLPYIIAYLAPGYVFIVIFGHITGKDSSVDLKHIVFHSIVVSFIIKSAFDLFFRLPVGQLWNTVILITVSAILAYAFGIFFHSPIYDKVRMFLRIERTFNKGIWEDILKEDAWYIIKTEDPDWNYYGRIILWEEHAREPVVVLTRYQILDADHMVRYDFSDEPDKRIIMNLKDFDRVEQILNVPKKKPKYVPDPKVLKPGVKKEVK